MDRVLLDTDIMSEVIKGKDAVVGERAAGYISAFGRLTVATPTVMEIVRGFRNAGRAELFSEALRLLRFHEIPAFDVDAAILAGEIDGDLMRSGQPLGRIDPMLAAIALARGLVLVTGNTGHYTRIQALGYELRRDNWRHPAAADAAERKDVG